MKFFVDEPGYLHDKLWKEGEVIESPTPLPPSTWYHAEGGKPLVKGSMDAAHALMNKPVAAQQSDKDREIAALKAQVSGKAVDEKANLDEDKTFTGTMSGKMDKDKK